MKDTKGFYLSLIVIVVSEDTLLFGTNENSIFIVGRYIFYMFFVLFYFNSTWRHVNKRVFAPFLLILASFLIVMVINSDFRNGYFLQFLIVLIALKIANTIKFNEFIENFSTIIYYLSIASIVLFLFVSVFPPVINLLPTLNNIGDVQYGTILISNIMKIEGTLRNSSIFREPGVFGLYLVICLLYHFFYVPTLDLKRIFILFVALLTTYSTTAFLALILIIAGYALQGRNIKSKVYIFVGVIIFTTFLLPIVSDTVFSKLNEDATEYRSTLSRIASFTIPFVMFKDHPLGVGLSNFVELYSSYSYTLYGIEFKPEGEATNTFINTLAIYGFLFGLVLIFSVWRLSFQFRRPTLIRIIIFFVLVLLFSSQDLRFSLLFNVLMIYGFLLENNNENNIVVSRKLNFV